MIGKGISVIIPNWNGKDLLQKNLPFLLKALNFCEEKFEILIIDDGSVDDSVSFLRDNYPQLRIIELGVNRGFAVAVNEGVRSSRYEILIMLNSDIQVTEMFLEPLLSHFDDETIFAVSSKALSGDGKTLVGGRCVVEFKWGMIRIKREQPCEEPSFTFRASGGHSAFSKEKFLQLSGFDELFAPFYGEDEDICYRAWKRGWKIIYEPRSTVYHVPQSTIGRSFNRRYIDLIFRRNKLLFIWKNITDRSYLLKHILFVPFYLIAGVFLRPYWPLSFFMAIGRLGRTIKKKRDEQRFFTLKDKEAMMLIQEGRK